MKKMFTIALLAVSVAVFAQRDPQYRVDYELPLEKGGSIMISTFKSQTEKDKSLVLNAPAVICKDNFGIRLGLSDGSMVKLPEVKVQCVNGKLTATVLINPDLESKLNGKEITYFILGDTLVQAKYKDPNDKLAMMMELARKERGF